ncbi:iron complex transport system substrate-binding protein [Rhodococcus triatomae]|uniref:Iron complex transport system substrate-binding protein n=1 Tax=Rhodococcus triatomae TaxID=300028 RepID=A0A1G8DES0_9NOCA|nr:ABC transporter substrate-binding protein [Rhodococcus triatomae]SDH55939.1 iron complex transport system substrate-binding protein [Rhodococcus triatomae]
MPRPLTPRRRLSARFSRGGPAAGIAVAAAALLVAGCGSVGDEASGPTTVSDEPAATSYPLTLENCGETVTFEAPPERAVSLYQSSTEILLSLGLADRMVGTSTWFDPVLPDLAADNEQVPRLADNDPSLETVLDTEPDLVTSGSAHTFTRSVVADRETFTDLGVPTYQSPSVCTDADVDGENVSRTAPLTIDTLYREIRELAAVFDVQERGAELVSSLQSRMDTATAGADRADGQEPTVAFWFSGIDAPYMAGCCSAPGLYAAETGAINVFADTRDDWPEVNWEAVADRNPDVLVLGDLSRVRVDGDALDTKIAFLESNPVTAQLDAVRGQRYVVLTGSELDPGIREVDAVEKLAEGLRSAGY